jgi:hypothetical protein
MHNTVFQKIKDIQEIIREEIRYGWGFLNRAFAVSEICGFCIFHWKCVWKAPNFLTEIYLKF